MVRAAHALLAACAAVLLWRALTQSWIDDMTAEPVAQSVVRWGLLFASVAASTLAIVAGWVNARPRKMLVHDAVSYAGLLIVLFALSLGPLTRDVVGLLFITAVAARLAPAILAAIADPPWSFLFACALAVYVCIAAWHQAASLPLGDQVHYLLATDRLAHGSLDASIDPGLFRRLTTIDPSDADVATHIVNAPAGPRTVQGYALPLLLLPGATTIGPNDRRIWLRSSRSASCQRSSARHGFADAGITSA